MANLDRYRWSISELRRECIELDLRNAGILDKYTDEQLAEIFNGIGPDSFPEWLVDALDGMAPDLAPVCMIHDVEWLESDGTRESFKASNDRLRKNGKTVADAKHPWWSIVRYLVRFDARAFSKACQRFGFDIYRSYADKSASPVSCGIHLAC